MSRFRSRMVKPIVYRTPVAGGGVSQGTLATDLKVTSTTGGSQPFTFGQVFVKGEVPTGNYVTSADASSIQCDIRNRWDDGSAKYGVISGIATFTAGVQKTFNLTATTTAPSGSDVAEGSAPTASVTFTGDVTGTYNLASVWGVDRSTWSLGSGGRVRSIPGKVMSEFHYYVPTTDAHVAVWFYVRVYSNGLREIETVVENGWLNVASPTLKTYSITVSINGSTVYTGSSLAHYHHTRWSRRDWHGTDPQCKPQHNAVYLRRSKMAPNYGYTAPTSAAWTGLATALNPAPFAQGDWSVSMSDTGYQQSIGILPRWEALYCTSTDSRAYDATVSNGRGAGRWPTHYRDENTGRICRPSSYPSTTLTSGWGTPPPSPSGGGPAWDIPHHPSQGYLPYLIEGRWSFLEEIQFTAMVSCLESNQATRYNGSGSTGLSLSCINSPLTTRGAAWAWRSAGQAAAISPKYLAGSAPPTADANVQSDFATVVQDTASWIRARYITGALDSGAHLNTIGWIGQYDNYAGGGRPATEWWGGSWMVGFQGMAWGHIAEMEIEGLTSSSHVTAVRDFVLGGLVSMVTASDTTPNWRRAATYDWPYLKSSSDPSAPVFQTFTEMYTSYKSVYSLGTIGFSAGSSLLDHGSNIDTAAGETSDFVKGYGALKYSAVSMAVDANLSGASSSQQLIAGASNFSTVLTDASDAPQFGIVPRFDVIGTLALTLSAGSNSTALGDAGATWDATRRNGIQWCNSFFYDYANRRCHLIGKNASGEGAQRLNAVLDANTAGWTAALFGGSELGHVYDSFAYDPAAGHIYSGTWAGDGIQRWAYGAALDAWTSPYKTSTFLLTGGVQPAMCWHPNLFGAGDGGLLIMSESAGNTGRLVAWRKSTDTFSVVSGTTHTVTDSYPQRGGMIYVPGGDYVIAAFLASAGGSTFKIAAGSGGTIGTVTTLSSVPISTRADGGGVNTGILLPSPTGADAAYILEKGGTSRVWKWNGSSWTLKGYTHPFETGNTEYVVASCAPHGVFLRMYSGTASSMMWRPND